VRQLLQSKRLKPILLEKAEDAAEAAETKTKAKLERKNGYVLQTFLIRRSRHKSF
jgi:hypothetical protein